MKVENPNFKAIDLAEDITYPLLAGTPVDLNGHLANNSYAKGIVFVNLYERPLTGKTKILVSGDIDLEEVEYISGVTYTDEAKASLGGMHLFSEDMDVAKEYILPTASSSKLGGVKIGSSIKIASGVIDVKPCVNVAVASGDAPTKAEFDALLTALINAGFMEEAEEE